MGKFKFRCRNAARGNYGVLNGKTGFYTLSVQDKKRFLNRVRNAFSAKLLDWPYNQRF